MVLAHRKRSEHETREPFVGIALVVIEARPKRDRVDPHELALKLKLTDLFRAHRLHTISREQRPNRRLGSCKSGIDRYGTVVTTTDAKEQKGTVGWLQNRRRVLEVERNCASRFLEEGWSGNRGKLRIYGGFNPDQDALTAE